MPYKPIWITLAMTFWSGMVSWGVARWTLSNQTRLNDKKDLVKLIEEVEAEAVSYWLSTGRDKVSEVNIIGRLKKVSQEIQRIYKPQSHFYKQLERQIIDFRKEITGGGFESENRFEEQGRATNIQDISCQFSGMIKDSK